MRLQLLGYVDYSTGTLETVDPWAALTLSLNKFRVLVSRGHGVVYSMRPDGNRRPERAKAQAPQQSTRSQHAATSLTTKNGTRPSSTSFHRVLARPVFEPRCAGAPIELCSTRQTILLTGVFGRES